MEKKGQFYNHKSSPLVFLNDDEYIGSCKAFLKWAENTFRYIDNTRDVMYKKMERDQNDNMVKDNENRSYVYLGITYDGGSEEKVHIELFEDLCPKTCDNFKQLCKGFKREGAD